jgi:DNA-directed RNA polymerase omega subunit
MPTVLVVTGPSGAGKGTLIRELVERVPGIEVTVSATTRERRRAEEDGREYWFLSDDDFLARVARGEFLEHVDYVSDHRYGTLRSELERIATHGNVPLLELETEGALRVKHELAGAVTIFISARVEELERRDRERQSRAGGRRARAARDRPPIPGSYDAAAMIEPRVDDLLENVDSRYALVIVAAKRARQINNYHHQLGEGTFGDNLPPLVESRSKNYLTMALEEVSQGMLKYEYTA